RQLPAAASLPLQRTWPSQAPKKRIVATTGEVVRPEEVLVVQVIFPDINMIGKDFPNHVAVLGEEGMEVPQQKARENVDPPILELNEPDPPLRKGVFQPLKHQMFGALHVQFQEINPLDAFARQELVTPDHRAVNALASPPAGILRERRVSAGGRVITERQ